MQRIITRKDALSIYTKFYLLFFHIIWLCFVRWIPRRLFSGWKRFIINLFGGDIKKGVIIYSSCRIHDPRNLVMEEGSEIGPKAEIYNVDYVTLKKNAIISQYTYICTASHDITKPERPLVFAPIIICENVWVAAYARIGKGVTIGKGAVVALGSVVIKDVDSWTIVGGNPAEYIKERIYEG